MMLQSSAVAIFLALPVVGAVDVSWNGKCDCSATVKASEGKLSREVLGYMPEPEDFEVILPIDRRSNMTFEIYMTEYFAYGRPVIIEGATEGWPMFALAGGGNPQDAAGDAKFKEWIVDVFGQEEHMEMQSEVQDDGTYIHKNVLKGGKVYIDKALAKGRQRGLPEGKADFNGLYEQMNADNKGFDPFKGLWNLPHFLPFLEPGMKSMEGHDFIKGSGGSAYVGGPPEHRDMGLNKGHLFHRHQDWGSCLVGMQAQVRGSKRWRIQSDMTGAQLSAPPFAGILGNKNVVYEGEIHPGELLFWPVQLFHETVGETFSFAFQHHIAVPVLRQAYKQKYARDTFDVTKEHACSDVDNGQTENGYCQQGDSEGAMTLPINMFYQKLLAHFACNDQLRGWYCDNAMCVDEWTSSKHESLWDSFIGRRMGRPDDEVQSRQPPPMDDRHRLEFSTSEPVPEQHQNLNLNQNQPQPQHQQQHRQQQPHQHQQQHQQHQNQHQQYQQEQHHHQHQQQQQRQGQEPKNTYLAWAIKTIDSYWTSIKEQYT